MDIVNKSLKEYLDILSSKDMPGGGSASALSSAQGVSLLMMVINLSINNKNFTIYNDKHNELLNKFNDIKTNLEILIDEDIKAFNNMLLVFKMSKTTDEEIKLRNEKMNEAIDICIKPPINIIELSQTAIEYAKDLHLITTKNAVSDIYCGVISLKAGVDMAYQNILINTNIMSDKNKANNMLLEIDKKLQNINKSVENIMNNK